MYAVDVGNMPIEWLSMPSVLFMQITVAFGLFDLPVHTAMLWSVPLHRLKFLINGHVLVA
jgi:hypothetical protein